MHFAISVLGRNSTSSHITMEHIGHCNKETDLLSFLYKYRGFELKHHDSYSEPAFLVIDGGLNLLNAAIQYWCEVVLWMYIYLNIYILIYVYYMYYIRRCGVSKQLYMQLRCMLALNIVNTLTVLYAQLLEISRCFWHLQVSGVYVILVMNAV